MIHDAHVDVREPANADISLMDEESTEPIVSKPIEEPTPYSELWLRSYFSASSRANHDLLEQRSFCSKSKSLV